MAATVQTKYALDQRPLQIVNANITQAVIDVQVDGVGSNGPPSGGVTVPVSAYMDAGRNGIGVHARGIYVEWINPPDLSYSLETGLFIPILRFALWREIMPTMTGSYRGGRFRVVGKRSESVR